MKISAYTKPDLDIFRRECNFTDFEAACFELKAKDYTNIQLSVELNVSESTVAVTMKRVRSKIMRIIELGGLKRV